MTVSSAWCVAELRAEKRLAATLIHEESHHVIHRASDEAATTRRYVALADEVEEAGCSLVENATQLERLGLAVEPDELYYFAGISSHGPAQRALIRLLGATSTAELITGALKLAIACHGAADEGEAVARLNELTGRRDPPSRWRRRILSRPPSWLERIGESA
jgi:hypothetical protein